ncbi:MAG: 4-hydroxy-tetrahydrodipicolinate synthase [Clostridiales bacterium]|nr:4-hydroxy-tetrahydrodipicolinate synthase [Clostridiales bacterium]
MSVFKGSGVAIVTPMGNDGSVNYKALEELIEFQIKNGTDAIVVCGTTGEASTLNDDEQLECIRFAASVVNKRVPVIAGAGSNDSLHGVKLCKGSQKAGADALLLVTPYYNKCTQKGLIAHFKMMAASADIPVILYSVKSRTGLNIEPLTVYELSKVENITGIKEASADISQIAHIAELCGNCGFDLYSGNDDHIVPVLSLGGVGVISTTANVVPKEVHDIVMKFLAGDAEGSREIQFNINPLVRALFSEVNPIPVKAALNLMGFNAGGYRMPLCEMEATNLEKLKITMKDYGLI